jgi:ornithine decarboxylase
VHSANSSLFDLTSHLSTPLLVLDENVVRANVIRIKEYLPHLQVYYALKCNDDYRVMKAVAESGGGFEVASLSETARLIRAGIPPEKISCLHPVKSPELLSYLHTNKIKILAADSKDEIKKIARFAPNSCVALRLVVSNEGSLFPLNRKFGVQPDEALELIQFAYTQGLREYGFTIHVGTQCERLSTWQEAIRVCEEVCNLAQIINPNLKLISLGGGLPVTYLESALSLKTVCESINQSIASLSLPSDCAISVEPGRAIAANAGTIITTVLGVAVRGQENWAYLDAGIYHGLFEAAESAGGFRLPVLTENKAIAAYRYYLGGPSCDSFDVLSYQYHLPELRSGDRLAFQLAGAYSNVLSTEFNGFPSPTRYYLNDLLTEGAIDEPS